MKGSLPRPLFRRGLLLLVAALVLVLWLTQDSKVNSLRPEKTKRAIAARALPSWNAPSGSRLRATTEGARVRLICRPSAAAEVQRVLAAESALLTATEAGSLSMSYPM